MLTLEGHERFTNAVFRNELRRLNSHLPKERLTLGELLSDPSPKVRSVSGHLIRMRKNELEDLSKSLPDEESKRIRLPFVILRRRDLGTGAFTVVGDAYDEFAVLVLTGSLQSTFEDFNRQNRDPVTIYKPQVSQLLRRFHSLTVIGFGPAGLET